MLLVDARVRVRRVLRAVLTWLLVLVSTVETALRCELISMVVVAKVIEVGVVVWVGRHVARKVHGGLAITCWKVRLSIKGLTEGWLESGCVMS